MSQNVILFARKYQPCQCGPTNARRNYFFARALSEAFGAEVQIISRSLNRGSCSCYSESDDATVRVPADVAFRQLQRFRLTAFLAYALRAVTEFSTTWPWNAYRAARRISDPDSTVAVAVGTGPFWVIPFAWLEAKRLNVPLLIDFHDSPSYFYRRGIRKVFTWLARTPVKLATKSAAIVCSVNLHESQQVAAWSNREVFTFDIGLDSRRWKFDDSEAAEPLSLSQFVDQLRRNNFVISYAGTYYDRFDLNAIGSLFERVWAVLSARYDRPPRIKILLAGRSPGLAYWRVALEKVGVTGVVYDVGQLPEQTCDQLLIESQLLVIPGMVNVGGIGPGGKIFDYIASGTPLLYYPVSDPATANLIDLQGVTCCATSDIEVATDFLVENYEAWLNDAMLRRTPGTIQGDDWKWYDESVQELVHYINDTLKLHAC